MQSAVNVKLGRREERSLLYVAKVSSGCAVRLTFQRTGVHTVADVFCVGCNDRLGWYYHKAADPSQKYKESKFHGLLLTWETLTSRPSR